VKGESESTGMDGGRPGKYEVVTGSVLVTVELVRSTTRRHEVEVVARMLTESVALRAYAATMNTLDISRLEPLLAEESRYASQMVLDEIVSKAGYLAYIESKLEAVRKSGHQVRAEMGELDVMFPGPRVVLARRVRRKIMARWSWRGSRVSCWFGVTSA